MVFVSVSRMYSEVFGRYSRRGSKPINPNVFPLSFVTESPVQRKTGIFVIFEKRELNDQISFSKIKLYLLLERILNEMAHLYLLIGR